VPKEPSTYEGLSGIFDALFTTAEASGKKTRTPNSAPVLFMYSDAFEQALPVVAGQVGAFPAIGNEVQRVAYNWLEKGGDLAVSRDQAFINLDTSQGYKTKVGNADVAEFEAGARGVQVAVNTSNIVSYFMDPSGFSEKLAEKWLEGYNESKKMKIIAGAGDAFQAAALYISGRKAGIDGDVAAFFSDVQREGHLFAKEKAKRDTFAPLDAQRNKDIREGGIEDRRGQMYSQAFAMVGGGMNKAARTATAAELETYLKTAGISITQLFDKNILTSSGTVDPTKLAAIQAKLGTVFAGVTDASARANLTTWLHSTGSGGFQDFAKIAAEGTARGAKAEGRMAEYAMGQLASQYLAAGDARGADRLLGLAATARGIDGKMTLGESLAYARSRLMNFEQKTQGVIGFTGLFLTGNAFRVVAEAAGMYGASATQQADFLSEVGKASGGALGNMGFYRKDAIDPLTGAMKDRAALQPGEIITDPLTGKQIFDPFAKDSTGAFYYSQNIRDRVSRWNAANNAFGGMAINKFSMTANDFTLSRDANRLQKAAYILHTYHPAQIVQGLVNGSFFQRVLNIESGFGRWRKNSAGDVTKNFFEKDASGKFIYSWRARWAAKALNNKWYQRGIAISRYSQYWARAPILLVNKGLERIAYGTKMLMQKGLNALMKLLQRLMGKMVSQMLSQILKRVLDVVSGGLGLVYDVLNTISFGLLDKLVGKALKVIIDFVILIVVGVLLMVVICANGAVQDLTNPSRNALNSTQEFPPDEFYNPDGVALPDFGTFTSVVTAPIDPSTLAQFQAGSCPWSASFTCTQGPYGGYSHGCSSFNGKQPAVDIVPSSAGIYAPVDGYLMRSGDYKCGRNGPSIGNFFEFVSTTGVVYGFMHSTAVKPVSSSQLIPKGTLIGAMSTSVPKSQCWTGPHIHAYVKRGGSTINAQDAFMAMCGNFRCSIGDTSQGACR
jgi:hypothetical protein